MPRRGLVGFWAKRSSQIQYDGGLWERATQQQFALRQIFKRVFEIAHLARNDPRRACAADARAAAEFRLQPAILCKGQQRLRAGIPLGNYSRFAELDSDRPDCGHGRGIDCWGDRLWLALRVKYAGGTGGLIG